MKHLIKVTPHEIGSEERNSVDAREIHKYLGVKTRFDTWIERAVKKYDFLENVDYIVVLKNEHNPKGGRKAKDYIVTLDMAKELSMLENNAKGKETRKYFISMEKKHLAQPSSAEAVFTQLTPVLQNIVLMMSTMMESQNNMIEMILKQEQKQIANALSPAQLDEIKKAVMRATKPLAEVHDYNWGEAVRRVYTELNGRMGVFSYYHISPKDYDEALGLLERMRKQKQELLQTGEVKTFLNSESNKED
ncbi:MAG: antA/AntB antirepressor family protein [Sulfurimonas sp.]|nr:antA/AntB antirepressor family protein [Sulfurimonas sp.]